MAKAEILLIEDDLATRHAIGLALKAMGHQVTVAVDCEEARASLRKFIFDLLIIDPRVTRQECHAIAHEAKALNAGTRIIIFTDKLTHAAAGDRQPIVDVYLPKPYSFHDLEKSLNRCLAGRTN